MNWQKWVVVAWLAYCVLAGVWKTAKESDYKSTGWTVGSVITVVLFEGFLIACVVTA